MYTKYVQEEEEQQQQQPQREKCNRRVEDNWTRRGMFSIDTKHATMLLAWCAATVFSACSRTVHTNTDLSRRLYGHTYHFQIIHTVECFDMFYEKRSIQCIEKNTIKKKGKQKPNASDIRWERERALDSTRVKIQSHKVRRICTEWECKRAKEGEPTDASDRRSSTKN